MAVTLNTDQEFVGVTVLWTTSSGGAATVQPGSVVWASSDETQLMAEGATSDQVLVERVL